VNSASWASSSISSSYSKSGSYSLTASYAPSILVASDITSMTSAFDNTIWSYSKSLFTPTINGMYRFNFTLIGTTDADWDTGGTQVNFEVKFVDEIGAYLITPPTVNQPQSQPIPMNSSLSGGFRWDFTQLFSGISGQSIQYYFDSQGIGITGSIMTIAKSSIEKLT